MTRKEEIARAAKDYHIKLHPNFTFGEYVAFIDGAQWADAHPHWISVEDELPPFDAIENGTWRCSKDVLIFAPFRGIFVGRYECDDMYGKTYWLFNGGSYPTVERGDGYESSNVTHWMPLPQAPKEGGEE